MTTPCADPPCRCNDCGREGIDLGSLWRHNGEPAMHPIQLVELTETNEFIRLHPNLCDGAKPCANHA